MLESSSLLIGNVHFDKLPIVFQRIHMNIDSGLSALLGATIGGIVGVIGTVISAWTASLRERRAFERANSQRHMDLVRETYQDALMVFFNMNRDGHPTREAYGTVYAQIALYGSSSVKQHLDEYLAVPHRQGKLDLDSIVNAMKRHLDELEKPST